MQLENRIAVCKSREDVEAICKFLERDSKHTNALIKIFLNGPSSLQQRSAWPLSVHAEEHPQRLLPYLTEIISVLNENKHPTVKRNIMRLIQFTGIPNELEGTVASLAFHFLNDTKETTAVKVFSMSALASISQRHPELKQELKLILESQLPYQSAGFRSRAQKILKTL